MDLILRNARRIGAEHELTDIGIAGGTHCRHRAAASPPKARASISAVVWCRPAFVETHIHLDKSCILDRCRSERGDLEEAIAEAAKAKAAFTPEDVHSRAVRTLEKAILQGTTHMRTHLEVDPGVGLRGLEGVLPLVKEYSWAIDLEICVFPQEGLLNNPGTDELMVEALDRGCRVVGGAPYTDSNPPGQIDRVFELARDYDIDVDMHLDFGPTAEGMDLDHVCRRTQEFQYGGRVAIGHVTKAASLPLPAFDTHGEASGRCGRGADRAALDRSLSDGPAAQARPQRHPRRRAGAQASAPRRQLLAVEQQHPQSVYAVRRLLADAHGQSLRQHLVRSEKRPTCASASTWSRSARPRCCGFKDYGLGGRQVGGPRGPRFRKP